MTDYINIGSSGFAQVGLPDYYDRMCIEMEVLLDAIQTAHPVPDEFLYMAYIRRKSFPHDFGTYHELVLVFNSTMLESWEDGNNDDMDKFDRFWQWANACEGFDMEQPELMLLMQQKYYEATAVARGEHLTIVPITAPVSQSIAKSA